MRDKIILTLVYAYELFDGKMYAGEISLAKVTSRWLLSQVVLLRVTEPLDEGFAQ